MKTNTTNTKTLITIKTDKSLKASAQAVSEEIGIPLGTMVNAFLKQVVRNRSFEVSSTYTPSPYLKKILAENEKEYAENPKAFKRFSDVKSLMKSLRS